MEQSAMPDLNTRLAQLLDEAEGAASLGESPPPPDVPSVTASPEEASHGAIQTASHQSGPSINPALLTALPTLLENLGPLLGALSGGVGSGHGAARPHTVDRHTALLCAVKPYLSPERQSAAETVIRLCRIWDALERSGISLTGLLASIPVGGGGEPPEGR